MLPIPERHKGMSKELDVFESTAWKRSPHTKALVNNIKERIAEIEADQWRGALLDPSDNLAGVAAHQMLHGLLEVIDSLGSGKLEQMEELSDELDSLIKEEY